MGIKCFDAFAIADFRAGLWALLSMPTEGVDADKVSLL
jgi:hypothetical protein